MRRLNRERRHKDKPTNVLSFPLDKKNGEIFLNWPLIVREAPIFKRSAKEHALILFIHGLLHLKGLDHGSRMESLEEYYLNYLNGQTNSHRT